MSITNSQKEQFIQNIMSGNTIAEAALNANFHEAAYYRWRQSNSEEDIVFTVRINKALETRTSHVVDALYKNATDNNDTKAQIYWLNNRAGDYWKTKATIESGGSLKIDATYS